MYCNNITLISKIQIDMLDIEQVITNNNFGVGNRRLPYIYIVDIYGGHLLFFNTL